MGFLDYLKSIYMPRIFMLFDSKYVVYSWHGIMEKTAVIYDASME